MEWRSSAKWLETRGTTQDEIREFGRLYPRGCEMTLDKALSCDQSRVLDVVRIGCELMLPERRPSFAFYTLIQREQPIAELLRTAQLGDLAKTVEDVNWADGRECANVLLPVFNEAYAIGEEQAGTYLGTIAQICVIHIGNATNDAQTAFASVIAHHHAKETAEQSVRAAGLPPHIAVPGENSAGVDFALQAGLNAVETAMAVAYVAEESVADVLLKCCLASRGSDYQAYIHAYAALADAPSAETKAAALRLLVKTRSEQVKWIWATLQDDFG